MIVVPIASPTRMEETHRDVVTSPLFQSRLEYVGVTLEAMKRAIVIRM